MNNTLRCVKRVLLIWMLTYIVASPTYATQCYFFRNYFDESCPVTNITDIAEDKNGFIWINSTPQGVFRFDGYDYVALSSLTNENIPKYPSKAINIDVYNRLWTMSQGTIFIFDCNENHAVAPPKEIQNLDSLSEIYFVNPENAIVTSNDKLYRYCISNDKLELLKGIEGYACGAEQTVVWIKQKNHLLKYDIVRKSQSTYPVITTSIISKVIDVDNSLLIGTMGDGLLLYDSKNHSFETIIANDIIRDIERVGESEYYIATETGLYIYNSMTQKTKRFYKDSNKSYSLNDNTLFAICTDRTGGVWIGSFFSGLSYLPKRDFDYRYINPSANNATKMGSVIRAIVEDEYNNVWIGTYDGGLNFYKPQTGDVNIVPEMGDVNVHALTSYQNNIWCGTQESGIYIINPKNRRILRRITKESNQGLSDNYISLLTHKEGGMLYVGTKSGLHEYDPTTGIFKLIVKQIYPVSAVEDTQGNLWLATKTNLFLRKNGSDKFVREEFEDSQGITANYIKEISSGSVWIGTQNGLYEHKDGIYVHRSLSGNPNEKQDIRGIEEDRFGNLWISTTSGIYRLDFSDTTKLHFTFSEDPLGNLFNYNSTIKTEGQDCIYFGALNGLLCFEPRLDYNTESSSGVLMTQYSYYSKDSAGVLTQYDNSTQKQPLIFEHDHSMIEFRFSDLNFASPHNNQYSYFVNGNTPEWLVAERNVVKLHNLSPGEYTLKVRAVNSSGICGDELEVAFVLKPPFYLSVFAIVGYFIIIITIFVLLCRYIQVRIKANHNEFKKKLELDKEIELYRSKMNFFTAIVHEIRTPLTLIKAPLERIAANPATLSQNINIAIHHAQTLTNQCRELLDYKKLENQQDKPINKSMVNIANIAYKMLDEFSLSMQEKGGELETNLTPDLVVMVEIDVDVFQKVLGNLLHSAMKYSDKLVSFEFSTYGDYISISILNDGELLGSNDGDKMFQLYKGGNENQIESGIGMAFAYKLAQLHNWRLAFCYDRPGFNHLNFRITYSPASQKQLIQMYGQETQEVEHSEENTIHIEPNKEITVLVVEENTDLKLYLKSILSPYYKVLDASNGVEALSVLGKESADLILTDVIMSKMNGVELCQHIKLNPQTSYIPVIILTSDLTIASRLRALQCDADSYIEKPFSEVELITRISTMLDLRKKHYDKFVQDPLSTLPVHDEKDNEGNLFIEKIRKIIEREMTNELLSAEFLAKELMISKATLYRKLKSYVDMSITDFILFCRLKKASRLLSERKHMINEVSNITGFSSPSYFTKCFTKQFGQTPKQFVNTISVDVQQLEDESPIENN